MAFSYWPINILGYTIDTKDQGWDGMSAGTVLLCIACFLVGVLVGRHITKYKTEIIDWVKDELDKFK